jgi:predicted ABC-type ATPase
MYRHKILTWKKLGFTVKLWFLSLPSPEAAISRVAQRVAQGGHHIPPEVIRRRFHAGLENFHHVYRNLVDAWALYDSYVFPPKLLEWSDT